MNKGKIIHSFCHSVAFSFIALSAAVEGSYTWCLLPILCFHSISDLKDTWQIPGRRLVSEIFNGFSGCEYSEGLFERAACGYHVEIQQKEF